MNGKRPAELEQRLIDKALGALRESNLKAELKRNGKDEKFIKEVRRDRA